MAYFYRGKTLMMLLKNFRFMIVTAFAIHSAVAHAADAETLDVGGAKLGMSPEQVIAALTANGWKAHVQLYRDFQDEARSAARQPLKGGKVVTSAKFIKGKEIINAKFVALPAGAEMYSLQYTIDEPTLTFDDFAQRALQRYGKPDTRNIQGLSGSLKTKPIGWGKFNKGAYESTLSGSYLVVHTYGVNDIYIWLEDNGQRAKRMQIEIQKALAGLPKPKSSF
jgi:hypothetical protein